MPSGRGVISDKMQFPAKSDSAGGGGPGAEFQPRPWFQDERDGFITWLRAEFAAANAIIDSMCHHLRSIGEPGEYEYVISAIQQRRYNWNPVLHMQQYFSIGEVIFSLQQVMHRKQHRHYDHPKYADKEFKKSGQGYRQAHRGENWRENQFAGLEHRAHEEKGEEKAKKSDEAISIPAVEKRGEDGFAGNVEADSSTKITGNMVGIEAKHVEGGIMEDSKETEKNAESDGGVDGSTPEKDEKQNSSLLPKHFVGHEVFDGKSVNAVEGLKLYECLFDSAEISKLFFLVNELRAAGRRGEFQGHTYVVSKRPMKGHGREMIQFGSPIVDGPPEEWSSTGGSTKEHMADEIPWLLQDVINRIVQLQIMSAKPDSCIIDFYNEGDHSQPYMYPSWYGRPVCVLCLTECEMVFGRVIAIDNPGNFRGSLKLSLAAGSLLVVQGKSADLSKHAISSLLMQRILVTFTKCHPKKLASSDNSRLPPQLAAAAPPPWGPPLSRSPGRGHHPPVAKHYGMIPATGVLPAPAIRAQHLPAANGMQPLFVATPITSAVQFPAPVPVPPSSATWQPIPPRHSTPRLPVLGTGVFLPPPGSGQSTSSGQQSLEETNSTMETSGPSENENSSERSHSDVGASIQSAEVASEGKGQKQDCNGKLAGEEEQLCG